MPLSRRLFLKRAGALAAATLLEPCTRVLAQPRFASDPFALGIASGFPHPSGMTLWTRLAPKPLEGGGVPSAGVPVSWEVSTDEAFRAVVAQGTAIAVPEWGHSIHVDVKGLAPGRWYWYRFRVGEAISRSGRTRTAPLEGDSVERLRFAVASCQQYEQGYYVAYRHMAREDLDLVVHLGDYIYESSWGRNHVRKHPDGEPFTLDEYRNRHALYKSDENLQAAHAAFPWIVTWDDHEVQNDYANDRSQNLEPRDAFMLRRAAAYQAYYEHMPVPAWARPRGSDMQLYSSTTYGNLASFFVLDDRQYRSHQVCARAGYGGSNVVRDEDCPERLDPGLTLLGAKQEQWLHEGFGRARSRWNVIAQQTLMAQSERREGPGADFWTDGWDGYPKARERLLGSLSKQRVPNPLVVSGDIHMATVADLKIDFDDAKSPVVASEFVCPSITSQGPSQNRTEFLMRENPHLKFANGTRRGYLTLDLTPKRCTVRLRTVETVTEQNAPIRNLAIYAVEDGHPGAQRV